RLAHWAWPRPEDWAREDLMQTLRWTSSTIENETARGRSHFGGQGSAGEHWLRLLWWRRVPYHHPRSTRQVQATGAVDLYISASERRTPGGCSSEPGQCEDG
ncbi:unnamed protein product, partial [Ectocarpus sp. 13 AM-2016]